MENAKRRFVVVTDQGKRDTLAVSPEKAVRNVRYRIVMDGLDRRVPLPRDLAAMREIEIREVYEIEA